MYTISKNHVGEGCASEFFKINNSKRGFKQFPCKESAEIAHANQTKLAELGFAPRVYSEVGKVRIGKGKKLSRWGYITEVAQLICCPGNSCYCCDREETEDIYAEEIDNLVCNMSDAGWSFGDCHAGNVGYVRRGGRKVMVCIDTGDESVQGDDCYCITCRNGGCCHE